MDASVAASSSSGGDGATSSGAALSSPSPLPADMEDALANGLRHMAGRVGANCGERKAVVSHQLTLLEGLAAPPHTRVLMWLAVQVRLVLRMIFPSCFCFLWWCSKSRPLSSTKRGAGGFAAHPCGSPCRCAWFFGKPSWHSCGTCVSEVPSKHV